MSLRKQHILSSTSVGKDKGNLKGFLAEERGLSALNQLCKEYSFLYSARKATEEEDHLGVDLVLYSSDGIQYFQVKSSKRSSNRWRQSHPILKNFVRCVVVKPEHTKDQVRYHFAKWIGLAPLRLQIKEHNGH